MVFLEMRGCVQPHVQSKQHSLALAPHPFMELPRQSLSGDWDSHHLLTYGAGYSILANVVVQEHLKEGGDG